MRDIIIWGTGAVARRFYYNIMQEKAVRVRYFVDNAPVTSFYGHEVYRPTRENCSKYLVVVASDVYYEKIAIQMTGYGLKELRDFIPYEALGKEVVLVHGNCHVFVMKEYLKTSKTFLEKFYLYPLPLIQDNKKKYIKDDLLENCDIFIYQDIRKDNQFDERLSADYLSPKIHKRRICIPNVFGMGTFLYPQAEPPQGSESDGWNNYVGEGSPIGICNYRDENIDRQWREGERCIDKIAAHLEGQVYDQEYIRQNAETCFEKMRKRERFWDVKITDYIEQGYKEKQMFYEPAHPCNHVLRKISEGILEILGINGNEISEVEAHLAYQEMPTYQCVKEALGLNYETKHIRHRGAWEQSKLTPKDMDLTEYCREYCYWCYGWYPERREWNA